MSWTSRPPTFAASSNISPCSFCAVSQVGCRLIVASSAKIIRPRPSTVVVGASVAAARRNSSTALDDGVLAFGLALSGRLTGVRLLSLVIRAYPSAGQNQAAGYHKMWRSAGFAQLSTWGAGPSSIDGLRRRARGIRPGKAQAVDQRANL